MFILPAIFHTWEKPKNIVVGGYTVCLPRLVLLVHSPKTHLQKHSTACKQLHEKPEKRLQHSPVWSDCNSSFALGVVGGALVASAFQKSCSLNQKSCHLSHYECNIYPSTIYRKVLTLSNVQYATHKHQEHLHQCVRACASPSHRRRGPTVQYRNISENIITPLQDDFELF